MIRRFSENLQKVIDRISEIHAVDVNLYDLDGNLQVSSLPRTLQQMVLSVKGWIPLAYYHLNKKKEVQFFKDEKIGKSKFCE